MTFRNLDDAILDVQITASDARAVARVFADEYTDLSEDLIKVAIHDTKTFVSLFHVLEMKTIEIDEKLSNLRKVVAELEATVCEPSHT